MDAPKPQVFAQKDTPTGIKLQKKPIDGVEQWGGKAEAQRKGVRRTQRHHPGTEGDWADVRGWKGGRAGVRLAEAGRGRKIPLDGRNLGPTDTWEQVEGGNGGETGRGKAGADFARNSLGRSLQHGREA